MKSLHPTFLLVPLLGFAGLAQGQTTSAVPPLISYQGRVIGADGVDVGLTAPQSRTVIFRVWDSPTASQAANLLYSEQQTVTISKGEFSVLMGQGINTSGTPLGFSEMAKGPRATPAVLIGDVFNGTQRYLGVTVDDGSPAVDNEISPRQQIVSTAFAFRAKYAEMLGTANGGNSLAVGDNGNVGIGAGGFSTLPARLTLTGSSVGTGSPQLVLTDSADTNERLQIGVDSTGSGTGFIQANKVGTGAQNLALNANGGNVGIGTLWPRVKLTVETGKNGLPITSGLNYPEQTSAGLRLKGGNDAVLDAGIADQGAWLQSVNQYNLGQNFNLLLNPNGGHVGVGTAYPVAKLSVSSGITDSPKTSGTAQPGAQLRLKGAGNSVLDIGDAINGGAWLQSTDQNNLALKYSLALNPNGGDVGIGTITPSAKLEVAGEIKSSGKVVPVAEESLRMVQGWMAFVTGPNTTNFAGFSVTWVSIGRYRIDFTPPFRGSPAVSATAFSHGRVTSSIDAAYPFTGSTVTMAFHDSGGNLANVSFTVMAMGPR